MPVRVNSHQTCIILLNWNNDEDTITCLKAIKQLTVKPETVIVCDNGSTDASLLKISGWAKKNYSSPQEMNLVSTKQGLNEQELPPEFVLIKNGANLGYAAGNNSGIRVALSTHRFEFIWLLNNDAVPKTDALKHLKACAVEHTETGIFGSTIIYTDNKETVQCAGGYRYYPLTTICRAALKDKPLDFVLKQPEPKLDYIYGASFFVRAEIFKKCGLLSEDYFLYFEEIDFCSTVMRAGYRLKWCRESIVAHKGGATIKNQNTQSVVRANSDYHENISALKFSKTWHPKLLAFILPFRFFGKITMHTLRFEWQPICSLLHAYLDYISQKDKTQQQTTENISRYK